MSIREILEKIKVFAASDTFFWCVICIILSVSSFCLGRLTLVSENNKELSPVSVQKPAVRTSSQEAATASAVLPSATTSSLSKETITTGQYVGSKKGTKYHLPWCSGAARISEANKIYFKDKASAEAAGYTPAGNCPGI